LVVLFITVFVAVVPVSIIIPMLPFIGQKYGASPFEVSLLFSLMPAMVIFVSPIWGRLSDRYGRKPIFLMNLAAGSLSFVIFGLADSLPTMFLARALHGLTGGNLAIAFAMVTDRTLPKDRARYLGYVSGAMSSGFLVGPVFGGILMGSDATVFDHQLPSFFAAGLSTLATLIGIMFLKETKQSHSRYRDNKTAENENPTSPAYHSSVEQGSRMGKIAMGILTIQFLITGLIGGSAPFIFSYWAQGLHNWGPANVSFVLAALGGAYMISTIFLIGPLTKKFNEEVAFIIGATVDFCGLLILILAPTSLIAVFGLWISALGSAVWITLLSSILTKISPPEHVGFMLGLSTGVSMFGRVLGPIAAGAIWLKISYTAPFIFNLCLLSLVIAYGIRLLAQLHKRNRHINAGLR